MIDSKNNSEEVEDCAASLCYRIQLIEKWLGIISQYAGDMEKDRMWRRDVMSHASGIEELADAALDVIQTMKNDNKEIGGKA